MKSLKFSKNLILIFVAVILITAVSGCGKKPLVNQKLTNIESPATTTNEIDTSDWETFVSKSCGYEIRYPSNWTKNKYIPNEYGCDLTLSDPIHFSLRTNSCNPNKIDIQEWLKSKGLNDRDNIIALDGVKAVANIKDLNEYNPLVLINFALGDRIFEIKWSDNGPTNEQNYQYFLKILDTLNFDNFEDSWLVDKKGRLINPLCGEDWSDYKKRLGFNVQMPPKYKLQMSGGDRYQGIVIVPEDWQDASPIIIPIRGSIGDALIWIKKSDSYVNSFSGDVLISIEQKDSKFKEYQSKTISLISDKIFTAYTNKPVKEYAKLEAVENLKTNVTFLLLNEMPAEEDVVLKTFELLD